MIRVGIAGLGFMGMVHYLTYQKLSGVSVEAICEIEAKRRGGDWRSIQGNFGPPGKKHDLGKTRTYARFEKMLEDPEIDLVDLTLPPSLHTDYAIAALRAGKHVFSEKPMALSVADCQRMARASESTGGMLFVGHVLPFFPEYAWALEVVKSGKYGRLLGGSFKRVISDPSWLKHYWSSKRIGGPMLDLHVHDAHFIRLLFGKPQAVITQGRLRGELAEHWNTQFYYEDNRYSVNATGGVIDQQGRGFNHAFEIHLEKATLAFEFAVSGDEAKYFCEPVLYDNRGKACPAKLSGGDPMDAFVAELREVLACLKQRRQSEVLNPELASDAILLCQRQTQSLRRNRKVRV